MALTREMFFYPVLRHVARGNGVASQEAIQTAVTAQVARECARLLDEAIATLQSSGVIEFVGDELWARVDLEEILERYRTGFEIGDLEENPALRHMKNESNPKFADLPDEVDVEFVSLDKFDMVDLADGTSLVIKKNDDDA